MCRIFNFCSRAREDVDSFGGHVVTAAATKTVAALQAASSNQPQHLVHGGLNKLRWKIDE